jgi:hypothetical protein
VTGEKHDDIAALRVHLITAGPGPLADLPALADLLARAWPDLDGAHDTSMASWKIARMETATWKPPVLAFTIERHGGTVLGSTRAEIQHWEVNLDHGTAGVTGSSYRQLAPPAARLKVEPLVAEIMGLIEAGADDPRLKWSPGHTAVSAVPSRVIPDGGYRQTVQGRRKRFREALAAALAEHGWEQLSREQGRGMWARRPPVN